MTPPFLTPSDRILRSIVRTLRAFDWVGAGLAAAPTIRHAKRRYATPDEYPCISIKWDQDEPRQADQDQQYMSSGEMYVEMTLTLEIDTDPGDDDEDETGMGFSSALAFLALRALKDPEGDLLANWANSVTDRGRGDDPDSTNDEARLEQVVIVLYRVSTEDPSVILAQGMNA